MRTPRCSILCCSPFFASNEHRVGNDLWSVTVLSTTITVDAIETWFLSIGYEISPQTSSPDLKFLTPSRRPHSRLVSSQYGQSQESQRAAEKQCLRVCDSAPAALPLPVCHTHSMSLISHYTLRRRSADGFRRKYMSRFL